MQGIDRNQVLTAFQALEFTFLRFMRALCRLVESATSVYI